VLVVDANVLLHAVNADAAEHETSRRWLEYRLSSAEPVGFAWIALLAFVRIGTRAGVLPSPMSVGEAFDHVEDWLVQPSAVVLQPSPRHAALLRGLLEPLGVAGNLASDAHLAALALEHGATVCTFDRDFARFPGVHWRHPLDDLSRERLI